MRRARPLLHWLAMLGWLAQLWLPVAHAGMAHHLGEKTWCGKGNAEMAAKFAELPAEIRSILDPSNAQPSGDHADCALACASGSGAALPPRVALALPDAAAERFLLPRPVAVYAPRQNSPPSTRGPPL